MTNSTRTRWSVFVVVVAAFITVSYLSLGGERVAAEGDSLVLVELFTSEGCSSCPPADTLLADLYANPPKGVSVVPLSFHVDYWDYLGWKDPFSAATYTQRQQAYAVAMKSDQVYTPQMVVNGVKGFVGSNRGEALRAIDAAGKRKFPVLKIELASESNDQVKVRVRDLPAAGKDLFVWVAVAEDELVSTVTRGENRGRALTHQAVVRAMNTAPWSAENPDSVTLTVPWDPAWQRTHTRLVAVVQNATSGEIFALGQLSLGSSE